MQTPHPQASAIPVRAGRICLVTSRSGNRLVVPKGCLEQGRTHKQIALQEAWEEAGLIGLLHSRPIGSYRYTKAGTRFEVVTFLMDVTTVVNDWPESRRRSRHWLRPADAAASVRERELRKLIRKALGAEPVRFPEWCNRRAQ
jgi:8-oxo-dGTP pyrophosphatase MutT (NUDIX family)